MANIRSFPNNQDEFIGAEDVMRWLHGRSSGVFGADGNASVAPGLDAMAITVSDGNGWISNDNADGVVWWIDNEETSGNKLQLEIDMADAVLPRIDRVVVSWQTTNYVALPEVNILKGTAASNPVAPALTNNNILRQISLASIRIPAGATAITSSMITDERLDDSVCGLVTSGIGVDTSVMQEQFSSLLESIKQELDDINNGTEALLKTGGTMYGVLDMGSNKIQNVADPTDDGDATNKEYVDGKMSMELLWSNPSPTSEFAPPSGSNTITIPFPIDVDIQEYDMICCELRASSTSDQMTIAFVMNGCRTMATGYNLLHRYRLIYFCYNNTSVMFSRGYYASASDPTKEQISNETLIPTRIYGIKGVK